ncbi:hypothetical protein KCP77_18015 [Salmonella enterica subsp. enterica]|nr:hypothetical protein KCP77_18015 [Salmonella enterica subsp. enterica]
MLFRFPRLSENLRVDSERILTELRTKAMTLCHAATMRIWFIVNTCGFIDSAVQESCWKPLAKR